MWAPTWFTHAAVEVYWNFKKNVGIHSHQQRYTAVHSTGGFRWYPKLTLLATLHVVRYVPLNRSKVGFYVITLRFNRSAKYEKSIPKFDRKHNFIQLKTFYYQFLKYRNERCVFSLSENIILMRIFCFHLVNIKDFVKLVLYFSGFRRELPFK